MSRYIDADEAIKIWKDKDYIKMSLQENRANEMLNDVPTADVVEVVRCKDCKNYMTIHCTCDGCCISDEWYCADGERKEQEYEYIN